MEVSGAVAMGLLGGAVDAMNDNISCLIGLVYFAVPTNDFCLAYLFGRAICGAMYPKWRRA